jgi:hypothetical protein
MDEFRWGAAAPAPKIRAGAPKAEPSPLTAPYGLAPASTCPSNKRVLYSLGDSWRTPVPVRPRQPLHSPRPRTATPSLAHHHGNRPSPALSARASHPFVRCVPSSSRTPHDPSWFVCAFFCIFGPPRPQPLSPTSPRKTVNFVAPPHSPPPLKYGMKDLPLSRRPTPHAKSPHLSR